MARIENRLWLAFVVLMFGCTPMVPISLTSMAFDDQASQRCGVSVAQPAETAWGATFNTIGDQSANVPVWWFLVHTLSKGISAAGTAAIPCKPDIRQIRMEIDESRIHDQFLLQEIADFTRDCYGRSRSRLFTRQPVLTREQNHDVSWIGSSYLLETPGYYDTDRSRLPRVNWPYDETRDAALARLPHGGGYPTCNQWWSDSGIGLRDRLVSHVDPTLLTRLGNWLTGRSQAEIEDATLRELVSPHQQSMNMAPGQVFMEYGSSPRGGSVLHGVNNLATNLGLAVGSFSNHSAINALRVALPMIQAFLLMGIVICLPLLLAVSTYQLKVVMMLTFAIFTLHMLTFWWELARWVDASLLDALYHHVSLRNKWQFTQISAATMDGTVAAMVITYVMGAMFVVLPMLFLAAMSWAGYAVGSGVDSMLSRGAQSTQNSASKGPDMAAQAVTRKMK